eukprot:4594655-Amphidinium_carterae.1
MKQLYKALLKPTESLATYRARLASLDEPDWMKYDREMNEAAGADKDVQDNEKRVCPYCGFEAFTERAEQLHNKKCTHRPRVQRGPRRAKEPVARRGTSKRPAAAAASAIASGNTKPPPLPPPLEPPPTESFDTVTHVKTELAADIVPEYC